MYKRDLNKLCLAQCYREPLAAWHIAFLSGLVKCCQHAGFLCSSQSGFSVDSWEVGLLKEWAHQITDGVEFYMRVMSDLGYEELWVFFLFVFFSQVLFSCCISMCKTSEVPQNSEISLSVTGCLLFLFYFILSDVCKNTVKKKTVRGMCMWGFNQ